MDRDLTPRQELLLDLALIALGTLTYFAALQFPHWLALID